MFIFNSTIICPTNWFKNVKIMTVGFKSNIFLLDMIREFLWGYNTMSSTLYTICLLKMVQWLNR